MPKCCVQQRHQVRFYNAQSWCKPKFHGFRMTPRLQIPSRDLWKSRLSPLKFGWSLEIAAKIFAFVFFWLPAIIIYVITEHVSFHCYLIYTAVTFLSSNRLISEVSENRKYCAKLNSRNLEEGYLEKYSRFGILLFANFCKLLRTNISLTTARVRVWLAQGLPTCRLLATET